MFERAQALFERYIGYKLDLVEYTKVFRCDDNAALIRNDLLGEVLSVRAKSKNWMYENFFGVTDWIDIPMHDVVIHEKDGFIYVNLPPTMFGTMYSEVEISYLAGHAKIPEDIIDAIREIERLLIEGTINEWNCILPVSVIDVIDKYRKEGID